MKLDSGCYPFYLNNGFLYYYAKNTKEIKGTFLLSYPTKNILCKITNLVVIGIA